MRSFVCVGVMMLAGCAGPRFVQVDTEGGIVAMPDNSNSWPTYHREKAEKMLQARCPKGYAIEKEEEFVVGVQTHTSGRTRTEEAPSIFLGGGDQQSTKNGNRQSTSGSFGGIAVPIGETRQRHEESTSSYNQTEWRIYYRANK